MKTTKKYHYVYRITNTVTKMHYYGDRSCNCHPSEDIGIKYFSTSTLKLFIQDQKNNPHDYKYKIIKIFETCREDAKTLESKLHQKFNVKSNPKFINRANQNGKGFLFNLGEQTIDMKNRIMKKAYETKKKNGTLPTKKNALAMIEANTGSKHSLERRMKQSESHKGLKASDETKKKMSIARKGKTHTAESKLKMSKIAYDRDLPEGSHNIWELISPIGEKTTIVSHNELDRVCDSEDISKKKLIEFLNCVVPPPPKRKYRGTRPTNSIGWKLRLIKRQFNKT